MLKSKKFRITKLCPTEEASVSKSVWPLLTTCPNDLKYAYVCSLSLMYHVPCILAGFIITCMCMWPRILSCQLPQMFKLGWPSQSVPVKEGEGIYKHAKQWKGADEKSVCCEHEGRVDESALAQATRPVGQGRPSTWRKSHQFL
jgi:hypothetical protein